jgi:hypothetical protein
MARQQIKRVGVRIPPPGIWSPVAGEPVPSTVTPSPGPYPCVGPGRKRCSGRELVCGLPRWSDRATHRGESDRHEKRFADYGIHCAILPVESKTIGRLTEDGWQTRFLDDRRTVLVAPGTTL